jgi:hypothetical protein
LRDKTIESQGASATIDLGIKAAQPSEGVSSISTGGDRCQPPCDAQLLEQLLKLIWNDRFGQVMIKSSQERAPPIGLLSPAGHRD